MDTFSRQVRSAIMAQVKSTNTGPELAVRRAFWSYGFRYARSDWGLPGSPDIVLPKLNCAVFVHGCFWHGHGCKYGKRPSSNTKYWEMKVAKNLQRDKRVTRALRNMGWHCFHIRTCLLNKEISRVLNALSKLRQTV